MKSVEGILTDSGLIHGVIYFPPKPQTIREFLKCRKDIRALNPDAAIYMVPRDMMRAVRDACFFWSCGIYRIIGVPWSRDRRVPRVDLQTGYVEREAARLARCLASLGTVDLNDLSFWDLRLQPHEVNTANGKLLPLAGKEFIAVNVGGRAASKNWGNENWLSLLRLISRRFSSLGLAFIGSADEFDRAKALASVWPGETLNLCGALKPRESAAVLKRALLFIGHDSGPMHLAAATGVRCVGIFGKFNKPKWFHPIGEGHRIIHNLQGIDKIAPGEVYDAVSLMLNKPCA